MMENPRYEEEKIIKFLKNLLRLRKNKIAMHLKIQEIFLD